MSSPVHCATCGSDVVYNSAAGEWEWPYACTWCDREDLPPYLRAPGPFFGPDAPKKLTRWQHFKEIFS